MRIGCAADLHYGIDPWIDQQVDRFVETRIGPAQLDLLVVAGDVAEMAELRGPELGSRHAALLPRLRTAAACPLAFCAGNHDIWCADPDTDSWAIYREVLPEIAARAGVTLLDAGNLALDTVTVVGCYGHFDFSLRVPALTVCGQPVTEEHYHRQTPPGYPEPVWMDGRRIRWRWNDPEACAEICASGLARMESALSPSTTDQAIIFVSHGIPRHEVNGHFRSHNPVSLFLNAFSGTARLEGIVRRGAAQGARILAVSGHTHKKVSRQLIEGVEYLNVGGTYGAPRLAVEEFA